MTRCSHGSFICLNTIQKKKQQKKPLSIFKNITRGWHLIFDFSQDTCTVKRKDYTSGALYTQTSFLPNMSVCSPHDCDSMFNESKMYVFDVDKSLQIADYLLCITASPIGLKKCVVSFDLLFLFIHTNICQLIALVYCLVHCVLFLVLVIVLYVHNIVPTQQFCCT